MKGSLLRSSSGGALSLDTDGANVPYQYLSSPKPQRMRPRQQQQQQQQQQQSASPLIPPQPMSLGGSAGSAARSAPAAYGTFGVSNVGGGGSGGRHGGGSAAPGLDARVDQLLRESAEQRLLLAAQQRAIEAQGQRLERLLTMLGGGGDGHGGDPPSVRQHRDGGTSPGAGHGSATSDECEL